MQSTHAGVHMLVRALLSDYNIHHHQINDCAVPAQLAMRLHFIIIGGGTFETIMHRSQK